jgi:hypothetical protein
MFNFRSQMSAANTSPAQFCRQLSIMLQTKLNEKQKQWFTSLQQRYHTEHKLVSDIKTFDLISYVEQTTQNVTETDYRDRWFQLLLWCRKEGRCVVVIKKDNNPNWMQEYEKEWAEESARAQFTSENLTDNFYKLLALTKGKVYCLQLVTDICDYEDKENKKKAQISDKSKQQLSALLH